MTSSIDTTIGRYYHRNSPVHRLDPRTKLLALIFLIISASIVRNLWGFIVLAAFVVVLILLSRLPLRLILRYFRSMIWLLVSIMLLHIFFADGSSLKPTWEGVYGGIRVSSRFLLIIAAAAILSSTTVPLRMADGIAGILRPLEKIRLPVHQLPIMMVITLHFIPTLFTEAERLMTAQKARGARLDGKNLLKKLKALTPVLVPLLRSSFRQADELAIGMESRCYHGGVRTHLHELAPGKSDVVALVASAAILLLILLIRYYNVSST